VVRQADDLLDGTCSLHCAAISLAISLDRGPKVIDAADFGATTEPEPLVSVDQATYLIGSTLPGLMTAKSKSVGLPREARLENDALAGIPLDSISLTATATNVRNPDDNATLSLPRRSHCLGGVPFESRARWLSLRHEQDRLGGSQRQLGATDLR